MKFATGLVLFIAAAAAAALSLQPKEPEMKTPTQARATDARDAGAPVYSKALYDVTPLTPAKVDELAAKLSPDEARVILKKGTEAAFCGNLVDNHKEGVYICRLCGLPLFSSDAKFDSGTGWPSFFQPFDPAHVREESDNSYGMQRTEINCARCGGHLGHVFDDGPRPTGLRFCLNSVSLEFVEKGTALPEQSRPVAAQKAYFAGGCFWGVEDYLQQMPGVMSAISGYQGGKTANPTYKDVCTDETGHAETVMVVFDPARVTYRQLLETFFKIHDPTTMDRQGPDVGTQYRSAIFAADDAQLKTARAYIEELNGTSRFSAHKIVTQVVPITQAGEFYPAEDYHQDYHLKHGGSCPLPER